MTNNRDDHPAGLSPDQVPDGSRSGPAVQHARRSISVNLPTERIALLDIPADLTAEEAVALMSAVAQIRAAIYQHEQAGAIVVPRSRIVLPT